MSHLIRTLTVYPLAVAICTVFAGCSATQVSATLAKIDRGLEAGEAAVEVSKQEYLDFCRVAPKSKVCSDKARSVLILVLERGPVLAGQLGVLADELADVAVELAPEHQAANSN